MAAKTSLAQKNGLQIYYKGPLALKIRPGLGEYLAQKLGFTVPASARPRAFCKGCCVTCLAKPNLLPNMPNYVSTNIFIPYGFDLALTALYDFTVAENIPF
jgi:hypothetical protein